jgi:hypothetical protein
VDKSNLNKQSWRETGFRDSRWETSGGDFQNQTKNSTGTTKMVIGNEVLNAVLNMKKYSRSGDSCIAKLPTVANNNNLDTNLPQVTSTDIDKKSPETNKNVSDSHNTSDLLDFEDFKFEEDLSKINEAHDLSVIKKIKSDFFNPTENIPVFCDLLKPNVNNQNLS